jgi:drug/metabolite transporter (DMT)-like permease
MAENTAPVDLAAETPPLAAVAAPALRHIQVAYLFAAAGALLFSTKAVAIKLAYLEPVDAETLLALRMLLAAPFYLAIGLWSLRDRARTGRPLPGLRLVAAASATGLLGYWVASYLDFLGLEYVSAQIERLILFTYPIFVVIFGALFFRQRITARAAIAVAISYAGLAVIFGQNAMEGGNAALAGAGLVLAAAVAFAFYQLLAKSVIAAVGPRLFTCISMLAAAAGAVVQFFLSHPAGDLAVSGRLWLIALFIAIGSTVLPTFLLNDALPASRRRPTPPSARSRRSPPSCLPG